MDEYTFIEEILDKRVLEADGRIEYYVKWKSVCQLENSWEPRQNLDCPKLRKEFDRNRWKTRREEKRRKKICNFRKQNRMHDVMVKNCSVMSLGGRKAGSEIIIPRNACSRNRKMQTEDKNETFSDDLKKLNVSRRRKTRRRRSLRRSMKLRRDDKGKENFSLVTSTNADEQVLETASGFARGLEPERIVGASRCKGKELFVLIQWKDSHLVDIVPAQEAHAKCPQILIDYYEKVIRWKE